MTFEEAAFIGLGLIVEADGTVTVPKVPTPMGCSDCYHVYTATNFEDRASCPRCYSSNVFDRRAES